MRMKHVLCIMIVLMLCISVVISPVSAADNWTDLSAGGVPAMTNLMDKETLQPQSTGYAALDAAIADRLSGTGNLKASAKLEWFYIWVQTSIVESTEGYSKPTTPAYSDWTWTYSELSIDPALTGPIPEEMACRVYHLLTQKKGLSYDRAAAFAVVARYLGFESYVHTGTFTLESDDGKTILHGWAELVLGGKRYVFDPHRDNACKKALKKDFTYYYYGIPSTNLSRYAPDTAANTARDALMRPLGEILVVADKIGTGTGTVTGGGTYKIGDTVTLTATPGAETVFRGWYDGDGNLISDKNTYTFTVKKDVALHGKFEGKVTLTVKTQGHGSGTVTPTTGTYLAGTRVMAKAIPDTGSVFLGWYDRLGKFLSDKNTFSFPIAANTTIYARFGKEVTLTTEVKGSGTVTGDGECVTDVPVTLTATPESGSTFMGWYTTDDELLSEDPTYEYTPTDNATIIAKFGITISAKVSCSGTVTGTGLYVPEEVVTLTASSETAEFEGWYTDKGNLLSESVSYSFVASESLELIAMFAGDRFYDIPASAWYRDDAIEANRRGLISGMAPFQFSASTPLTRAMVVHILAKLSAVDTSTFDSAPFTDVAPTAWYAKSINWAYHYNVVSGIDETHFNPNAPVTREQFLSILMRYAENYAHITVPSEPLTFSDTASISAYAVRWLEKANSITVEKNGKTVRLLSGYSDNTLRPKNQLTRAEGVAFVIRFALYLDDVTAEEPPSEPPEDGTPDDETAAVPDVAPDAGDTEDSVAPEAEVPSTEEPASTEEPSATELTVPAE